MATFNYSTQAQLLVRLRARFKTATGLQAAKIARTFAALTDAQLQAAFAITATQAANLRTRINAIIAKADALKAVAGE